MENVGWVEINNEIILQLLPKKPIYFLTKKESSESSARVNNDFDGNDEAENVRLLLSL